METQLQRQCSEALQATSLPKLLGKMVGFSQARAEPCLAYGSSAHALPLAASAELEALLWGTDGMTDWEIGRNLGCGTRYEAGLKAIEPGLVEGF